MDRGDVAGSSFSFNVFDDDWDFVNGETRRTLLSGKLIDVGPTSQPASEDSSVAVLRSLAAHVGAEYDEVRSLATAGDLRKLFVRTDLAPQPAAVEARAEDDGMMDLRRRQLALMKRKIDWDTPPMDPRRKLLELYKAQDGMGRP